MEKTVKVYEVAYHEMDPRLAYAGAAGDGSYVYRSRSERDAQDFAAKHEYYGCPAMVSCVDLPRRIAQRWGMA